MRDHLAHCKAETRPDVVRSPSYFTLTFTSTHPLWTPKFPSTPNTACRPADCRKTAKKQHEIALGAPCRSVTLSRLPIFLQQSYIRLLTSHVTRRDIVATQCPAPRNAGRAQCRTGKGATLWGPHAQVTEALRSTHLTGFFRAACVALHRRETPGFVCCEPELV